MNRSIIIFLLIVTKNQATADITSEQYASVPELFYEDNYDNCMLRGDEAFYCYIKFTLKPLNVNNVSETWNYIMNISAQPTNYRHDHLRHFLCVPKSCPQVPKSHENDSLTRKAIEDCYNKKFEDIQLTSSISEISCRTSNHQYTVDGLDKLAGVLFITYIIFVLFATCYENFAIHKFCNNHRKLSKFLSAFSITKNWNRLKTITSTPELEKLRGIQGLRSYNSALVVLSHTILCFLALPIANTNFSETVYKQPVSIFFACGHLCMTTFFFISSFLLSIDIFQFLRDKKGLSLKMALWILTYRLFRQLPSLAIMILFHATWLRHIGNGPHWDLFMFPEYKFCRKNWWTNLLFVNNLVDADQMCLQPTWWLALNTQYVVFSLVFIWALKKYNNHFALIVGASLSLSTFGTFLENYYYDFPSLLLYEPESWFDLRRFFASPQVTHQLRGFNANLAGPIIAISFGYYFNNRMNDSTEYKFFTTKLRIFFWWAMLIGVGLGCVVVPGLVIFLYSNEHSVFWASLYVALSRSFFSFFLGVLLIGFSEGVGWIALQICCWSPTYILGRLTYSVYLVHMCIVFIGPALSRFPVYMSEFIFLVQFSGDMVVVYITATLLTIFVELPVSALQKLIFTPTEEHQGNKENGLKKE